MTKNLKILRERRTIDELIAKDKLLTEHKTLSNLIEEMEVLLEKGIKQSHLFTAEKKPPECEDYVNEKVFAIDFDEKAVRVARTL